MTYLIINGPNLNMLGERDPSLYGTLSLQELERNIKELADRLGVKVSFFQSNSEGELVDYIQQNSAKATGIIINPGALTHYGISLRDALEEVKTPIIEVHLSQIFARESIRRSSVTGEVSNGIIAGLKWRGYLAALQYLVEAKNVPRE